MSEPAQHPLWGSNGVARSVRLGAVELGDGTDPGGFRLLSQTGIVLTSARFCACRPLGGCACCRDLLRTDPYLAHSESHLRAVADTAAGSRVPDQHPQRRDVRAAAGAAAHGDPDAALSGAARQGVHLPRRRGDVADGDAYSGGEDDFWIE